MEFNRAQLKREVKLSMKGSGCMMVTLLFGVVVSVGTWLLNTILGGMLTGGTGSVSETAVYYIQRGYDFEEAVNIALLELFRRGPGALVAIAVGGVVLSIIIALWQSAMDVGYEGWCLSMVRRENPPVSKIFCALPQILQVLATRFLTGLFIVLWSLLVMLAYGILLTAAIMLAALTDSAALAIPLLLAAVAALVVGIVWVSTRYLLVDYVLLDKGLFGLDAIRECKRLMSGNIGKGFVLQLSFFGWYLLMIAMFYLGAVLAVIPLVGAFAAGSSGGLIASSGFALLVVIVAAVGISILSLWLRPYVTGSIARFYDWTCASADGPQGGPVFHGGGDGWGGPANYTWTSGPASGSGAGSGPQNGGFPPPPPPKAPPKPRDDPWN